MVLFNFLRQFFALAFVACLCTSQNVCCRYDLLRELGLGSGATVDDIKKRCRQLRAELHPDHGGDQEEFMKFGAVCDDLLASRERQSKSPLEQLLERNECDQCALDGVNLDNKNLASAVITRASLTGATFRNTDLTGAQLVGSRCMRAVFDKTMFTDTDCTATNFAEAQFTGVDFSRVKSFENVIFEAAKFTDVDFSGANLRGAIFVNCVFTRVKFDNAIIYGADFTGARLTDTTLKTAYKDFFTKLPPEINVEPFKDLADLEELLRKFNQREKEWQHEFNQKQEKEYESREEKKNDDWKRTRGGQSYWYYKAEDSEPTITLEFDSSVFVD